MFAWYLLAASITLSIPGSPVQILTTTRSTEDHAARVIWLVVGDVAEMIEFST